MNGWVLVPRDIKESLMQKEWVLLKQKHVKTAVYRHEIAVDLLKQFGYHIEYPLEYNERADHIQESLAKLELQRSQQMLKTKMI